MANVRKLPKSKLQSRLGYFSDINLANKCFEHCEALFDGCKPRCLENPQCLLECSQGLANCIVHCPCFEKCPQGCEDCHSGFCECLNPDTNDDFVKCEEWIRTLFSHLFDLVFFNDHG